MYQPYVSNPSPLACEAQLQGVLAGEGYSHQFQLPNELLSVEYGCATPQLRQPHQDF